MSDKLKVAAEQADGLDLWAKVLEAHEPESSAKGILMLRAAAKTLRELAADAPPIEEMAEAAEDVVRCFYRMGLSVPHKFLKYMEKLRAVLTAQKEGE